MTATHRPETVPPVVRHEQAMAPVARSRNWPRGEVNQSGHKRPSRPSSLWLPGYLWLSRQCSNGPPTSYPDTQPAAVCQDSRRDDLKTAGRAAELARRRVLGHGCRRRSTNLRCLRNACPLVPVPLPPARVRRVRTLHRVRMVLRLQDLLRQHGVRPPEASSARRRRLSSVGAAGAASALGNEADRLPGPPGSRAFRNRGRPGSAG